MSTKRLRRASFAAGCCRAADGDDRSARSAYLRCHRRRPDCSAWRAGRRSSRATPRLARDSSTVVGAAGCATTDVWRHCATALGVDHVVAGRRASSRHSRRRSLRRRRRHRSGWARWIAGVVAAAAAMPPRTRPTRARAPRRRRRTRRLVSHSSARASTRAGPTSGCAAMRPACCARHLPCGWWWRWGVSASGPGDCASARGPRSGAPGGAWTAAWARSGRGSRRRRFGLHRAK